MKRKPLWKTPKKERPEDRADSAGFYASAEGNAHREKNAIRSIQRRITLRALELLALNPPEKLLDAGCGSGFSSEIAMEAGFGVVGFDADRKMVEAAIAKGIDARIGNFTGMPFDDGSFDCAVSISALQWLGAGKNLGLAFEEYHKAAIEFWRVLKPNGRAAIQFYPRDENEAVLAGKAFRKARFGVTLQVDSADNPKKRKVFLVLSKA